MAWQWPFSIWPKSVRTLSQHGDKSSGATDGCESFSGVARLVGSGVAIGNALHLENLSWRLDAIGL
jgi:hypothetical protein